MIIIIIAAVLLGIVTGQLTESLFIQNNLDGINEYVLLLLVFIVGIDLGKNVETWYKFPQESLGIKILI